jgi:hypothetical protein
MFVLSLFLFTAACFRTPVTIQSSNVPFNSEDYKLSPDVISVEDSVFYLFGVFPFGDDDKLAEAIRKLERMSPSGRIASITVDKQTMFIVIGTLVDLKITAKPLFARDDKITQPTHNAP